MQRDSRSFLWDVQESATAIVEFTHGKTFDDYSGDRLLRSAVERQFDIIGEALNQLAKVAPSIGARIPELGQVVAFRNILIHGYAVVDHATVWRTVREDLPRLRTRAEQLLNELGRTP